MTDVRFGERLAVVVFVLLSATAAAACSGSDESSDDDKRSSAGDERPGADTSGQTGGEGGGGSPPDLDTDLVSALTVEIQGSFTEQGVGDELPEDEAECAADSIIEQVGADRLEALGVTATSADALESVVRDPANTVEREAIADALADCVDLVRTLSAVYTAVGLSEESATCVAEGVVDDAELRTTLLLGDEPSGDTESRFDALTESCFTAEERQNFSSGSE